ncbi:hypothetical protein [Acinetobacter johnsonii]|uniref:hypothetical protein n=1 Tax=Acinetobacter johnsonii TaxID=40214 RepID=UPI0032B42E3B
MAIVNSRAAIEPKTGKAAIFVNETIHSLIRKLFANNEQGFAYDPNDLTTMFQDAAGTVPVTGVGQPVGLILDKSGRGNHARQTTTASRPILRQNAITKAYYLEFDGSDDSLVTNSIDFTATDEVSLFAGVRKLSTVNGIIFELSSSASTNNGSFYLASPAGQVFPNQILFANRGTLFASAQNPNLPPPRDVVVSAKGDISNDTTLIRTNGLQFSSADNLGTGNYGNYPLYIGRRGDTTIPFNGHLYSLIGVGRLSTDAETIALEKEVAKRTGVTLSV